MKIKDARVTSCVCVHVQSATAYHICSMSVYVKRYYIIAIFATFNADFAAPGKVNRNSPRGGGKKRKGEEWKELIIIAVPSRTVT